MVDQIVLKLQHSMSDGFMAQLTKDDSDLDNLFTDDNFDPSLLFQGYSAICP